MAIGDGLDFNTNAYPVLSSDTSDLIRRVEPLLTPEKLISRYLKGVDLKKYSSEELKDKIHLAMNEVEGILNTTITKELRKEKHPFDQNLYKSFIHIMTNFRPILTVESLQIASSNQVKIFKIPPSWIESARFFQGQVNVIPLTVVGATGINQGEPTGAAGLMFIAAMNGGITWVPSYWQIEYTTGLCNKEGQVPVLVNEVIGAIAAISILSMEAALNKANSVSVSHDGVSQSQSGPGPQVYVQRINDLTQKKDEAIKNLKKIFQSKLFISNM